MLFGCFSGALFGIPFPLFGKALFALFGRLGGSSAPRRMFVKPCFYFALVPLFKKTRRFDAARFDGRGVCAVLR